MLVFPNAKINVGLNITERRSDGYHNILSCFYPVAWQDALEILPSTDLSFQATGIPIPGNPMENLVVKAWETLQRDFVLDPVKIHLHKVIPIGAGLGGGSADGAFAIKALNELFDLGLSLERMEEYAGKLGSDCPFFIRNKPVLVSGTGNIFEEAQLDLSTHFLILAYPGIHIGTGEAYAGIRPKHPYKTPKEVLGLPIEKWKGNLHNDFEDSLLKKYPVLLALKEQFYAEGAVYASMTGSGSAVYGIFTKPKTLTFPEDMKVWSGMLKQNAFKP